VRQAALEKEWELAKTSVKQVGTANVSLESHGSSETSGLCNPERNLIIEEVFYRST
jgi:hypothetical protein